MNKQDKNENVTVDDLIEEFGAGEVLKVFSRLDDEDLSWAKNLMINAKK